MRGTKKRLGRDRPLACKSCDFMPLSHSLSLSLSLSHFQGKEGKGMGGCDKVAMV